MGTPRPHSFLPAIISKAMLLLVLLLGANIVVAQIAQRGASTSKTNTSASTTIVINKPTGVIAGDVMIASILQNETDNDNGGLANPTATGWTLIDGRTTFSEGNTNGLNAWYGSVFYRVADGSEGTTFTFTYPNNRADMSIGSIVAFSGVSVGGVKSDGTVGGPFDIDPGNLEVSPDLDNTATAASVTTTTDNAAVILLSMTTGNLTHSGWVATSPSSLTEVMDYRTNAADDGSIGAAWALKPIPGATGNGSVTISNNAYTAAMFLVLKPCSVAGSLSGTQALCSNGSTTIATNGSLNGTWSSGTASVATVNSSGVVTGISAGTSVITYSFSAGNGCAASSATRTVTVTAAPNAGDLSGTQNICPGETTTFSSNGTSGGTWTSGGSAVATVNTFSGVVSGVSSGTATMTYTVVGTGGCSNATATRTVTVGAATAAPSVTGDSRCGSGTLVLQATPPANAVIDWYDVATNGTALLTSSNTFTTPSLAATTTYYAEARHNTSGCSSSRTAVSAAINPAPTGVTASVSPGAICSGETLTLSAAATSNSASSYTMLSENFNAANAAWTITNNSTGGTPANAAWTIRANNYNNGTETFVTSDASSFMFSDSDAQGSGAVTDVSLVSPAFSTVGVTSANISLNHYFRLAATADRAYVDISLNGTTWTNLATYSSTQGVRNAFATATIPLTAPCLNQPTVYVRLRYTANWGWYWAINSITVASTSTAATFSWTSSPAGYNSSVEDPTDAAPLVNTSYTVTATNNYGCSVSASTSTVTVTASPSAPTTTNGVRCGSGTVNLSASTAGGNTINWYSGAIGGASLANTSSYTTPSLSSTTTYYASAYNSSSGCYSSRVATTATVNPVPSAVSAAVSGTTICLGESVNLTSSGTSNSAAISLISEDFNTTNAAWTLVNNSTGGTPANAAFTIQANNYNNGDETFTTTDGSAFIFSDSDLQGSGSTTDVSIISPAFSTQNIETATVNLNHYFRRNLTSDRTYVDVSLNGTTWVNLTTYSTTQGASNNFATVSIPLTAAYLNQPTVYIRLRYTAAWGWYWAVNSLSVSAIPTPTYSWSSNPAGYTSSLQNPTGVAPTVNTAYTLTATNNYGCESSATTAQVVANVRPTGALTGSAQICSGNSTPLSIALTGNGPWSGTLSNGQSFTAAGNPATIAVSPSTTTTYTVSSLSDANCPAVGGLSGSAAITVNALPTASITGSAVVCGGNSGSVTINGPANGQVVYTLNGNSQSVALSGSGSATINTGTVWQNLTYSLATVEDALCQNTATGTATITYQEAPDATISGSTQLCSGQSTAITFNGNSNAVITYNVNGGANQNITLNGSGNGSVNTGSLSSNTTYNLVSVAVGSCSSIIGTSAVVNVGLVIYYQDNDGDGYGNASVSTVACTQPAGYVTVAGDCCDSNADLNPVCEWWGDMDGDGYGSFIYEVGCLTGVSCSSASWPAQLIPYCPLAHGGTPYAIDCNENSVNVNPGVTEVCNNTIDDDCDGFIGEACSGQVFDQWSTAQLLNVNTTNAYYPNCQTFGGTLVNTDVSTQGNPANVAAGGGRDVWYRFVAPSTGVRIRVTAAGFNPVLELQNASGTQVDAENVNPAIGGTEILNYGNLTVGQTYYVGVRNYDATNVGTYTICVSPLRASGCATSVPAGGLSLCSSFKVLYTGATSYTLGFAGIGGSANGINSNITSLTGIVSLGNQSLGLRYGGVYNVQVDANYSLTNGLGQTESMITVLGNSVPANCQNVAMMQQPQVEVRNTYICPTVLARVSSILANPVAGASNVCGAINYTFEFTRVSDCLASSVIGTPFTVNTTSNVASLALNTAFPTQLSSTGYWSVRIRPNFGGNFQGNWGPAKVIAVSGSAASQMLDEEQGAQAVKTFEAQPLSVVYPNPNNGSEVNINLTDIGSGELAVKIVDALGRMIYTNRFAVDGSLFTKIDFAEQLTGGIYLVEFTINGETMNERMIVER